MTDDVAVMVAVGGTVMAGQSDIEPDRNSIHQNLLKFMIQKFIISMSTHRGATTRAVIDFEGGLDPYATVCIMLCHQVQCRFQFCYFQLYGLLILFM